MLTPGYGYNEGARIGNPVREITQMMPNGASSYNGSAMSRHLEAVYEQGVLRPLEPLALAEHQRVRLTLEENPSSWLSTGPVNERREEMQWLAKESGPYAGQWVALDGPRLVAHGSQLAAVSAEAKAGVIHG